MFLFPVIFSEISEEMLAEAEFLESTLACAIYGTKATHGAILISSKKGKKGKKDEFEFADFDEIATTKKKKRSFFREYAFWQPAFQTDKEGKVKFWAQYPDDLTQWKTIFLAKKGIKSGVYEQNIKSALPLAPQLAVPTYLTFGDTCLTYGIVSNYRNLPEKITSEFTLNTKNTGKKEHILEDGLKEILQITASMKDSIKLAYQIKNQTGYEDGEERKIVVNPLGQVYNFGDFHLLSQDTILTLKANDSTEQQLDIFVSKENLLQFHARHLQMYSHDCNEQLASKLIANLYVFKTKNRNDVSAEKNIKDILKRLKERENNEGLWSWYAVNQTEFWTAKHILYALHWAEKEGFDYPFSDKIKINLVLKAESFKYDSQQVLILELLKIVDEKTDLTKYLSIFKPQIIQNLSLTNKVRCWLLMKKEGFNIPLDSVLVHKKVNLYGGYYWDDKLSNFFYDDKHELTAMIYQLFKNDTSRIASEYRSKIELFFETELLGGTMNTFQTAKKIYFYVDFLPKKNQESSPFKIRIGEKNYTPEHFPFSVKIPPSTTAEIEKKGGKAFYLSVTKEKIVLKEQNCLHFNIAKISFENEKNLKAGENTQMNVKINVNTETEFVSLEIPIAAAFELNSNKMPYFSNSVGYKTDIDKITIYFRKLPIGEYNFAIPLRVRFAGKFSQNPVRLEAMYLPIVNAVSSLKHIEVK